MKISTFSIIVLALVLAFLTSLAQATEDTPASIQEEIRILSQDLAILGNQVDHFSKAMEQKTKELEESNVRLRAEYNQLLKDRAMIDSIRSGDLRKRQAAKTAIQAGPSSRLNKGQTMIDRVRSGGK